MSRRFNDNEKLKLVKQLIGPNAKSALALSKELGGVPSQTTLLRWSREMAPAPVGSLPKGERPIERYTRMDRNEFVLKTMGFPRADVLKMVEEKGITPETFDMWRVEYIYSLSPMLSSPGKDDLQKENENLKQRLKELEDQQRLIEEALEPLRHRHAN